MSINPLIGRSQEWEHSEDQVDILSEINITPLTDIFLVLLIIFMVTSSVMSQMGVDVDLPQASHTLSQSQPEGVVVTLLANGQLKVNQVLVSSQNYAQMKVLLQKAFQTSKSRLVILEGDQNAFLGSAIKVMDVAKEAGAKEFAIATHPPEK